MATLVSLKINDRTTWAKFHALVVQAVQSCLCTVTVAALKRIKEVKFDGDLDATLGEIQRLTLDAYPQSTREEA